MITSGCTDHPGGGRWHATALSVLLALFVFRVAAQLMQFLWPTPLLPPFRAWHSETLPYGVLVAAQMLIILAVAFMTVQISRRRLKPKRNVGSVLLVLGTIYMLASIFRLAAGMSFLADLSFFKATPPAVFHLVLAGIVLTLGHFHFRGGAWITANARD